MSTIKGNRNLFRSSRRFTSTIRSNFAIGQSVHNASGDCVPSSTRHDQTGYVVLFDSFRYAFVSRRPRNFVPVPDILHKEEEKMFAEDSVFLKSLEGFLLVLSHEGDIVYLSENVADYLGITQVRLFSVLDFYLRRLRSKAIFFVFFFRLISWAKTYTNTVIPAITTKSKKFYKGKKNGKKKQTNRNRSSFVSSAP